MQPNWSMFSKEHLAIVERYLAPFTNHGPRDPDLVIAPDGKPYLYRWHLVPAKSPANVYFHVQVASDPARPLHDHPWDNMSVILAGGYTEKLQKLPPTSTPQVFTRKAGDTIYRKAAEAHRLILPPELPYTITLFATGPKVKDWGFWYPKGWVHYQNVTKFQDGVSIHPDLAPESQEERDRLLRLAYTA